MKSKHIFLFAGLLVLFAFTGCKKDFPAIGDYPSKVEGLQGTWKAQQVIQVDYDAKEKGENLFQWDVSHSFNLTDYTIVFNANGTFVISGTAHNFAKLSSGTWAFDNPTFPSKINLTDGATTDAFAVIAPPRTGFDMCTISYDRYASGKKIIGYQYYLKKQ
ncbi:MAG: DUF5004 domain-containing protein [Bacteroidota bacterium]